MTQSCKRVILWQSQRPGLPGQKNRPVLPNVKKRGGNWLHSFLFDSLLMKRVSLEIIIHSSLGQPRQLRPIRNDLCRRRKCEKLNFPREVGLLFSVGPPYSSKRLHAGKNLSVYGQKACQDWCTSNVQPNACILWMCIILYSTLLSRISCLAKLISLCHYTQHQLGKQ